MGVPVGAPGNATGSRFGHSSEPIVRRGEKLVQKPEASTEMTRPAVNVFPASVMRLTIFPDAVLFPGGAVIHRHSPTGGDIT